MLRGILTNGDVYRMGGLASGLTCVFKGSAHCRVSAVISINCLATYALRLAIGDGEVYRHRILRALMRPPPSASAYISCPPKLLVSGFPLFLSSRGRQLGNHTVRLHFC